MTIGGGCIQDPSTAFHPSWPAPAGGQLRMTMREVSAGVRTPRGVEPHGVGLAVERDDVEGAGGDHAAALGTGILLEDVDAQAARVAGDPLDGDLGDAALGGE